jgi:4-amino-4-deoxy-L-arabinose transferase-like glycosyltransferase
MTASPTHVPTLARALGWITLERLAYMAIAALALILRLASLHVAPMSPVEAVQAMAALDLVTERGALTAAGASPLLLVLQWLTFLLAQATETAARIVPALAGTTTVLLAYGLRAELGRLGALAAALLLAVSSTLVFWSRSATGESLALLAGMALIVGLAGWRRSGGAGWLVWLAVALAGLLLSAPIGYSILLAAAPLAAMALLPAGNRRQAVAGLGTAGLVFVLVLLLGATGFFFLPGGLAAVAELPAAWLAGFTGSGTLAPDASAGVASSSLAMTGTSSVLGLGINLLWLEPLVLMAGLAGLVIGLRRRHWLAQGLGLWLAVALLLLLFRAGRSPADVAVLALPLALLGGLALAAFAEHFDLGEQRAEALVLLVVGLAILGSVAVWLAQYTESWQAEPQMAFLISASVALLVLVALLVAYVVIFGGRLTLQVGLALALVVLALLGLRGMLLTSHNRDGLRWGSWASVAGASGGPELRLALERLAMQRGTDLRDLPVAFLTAPGNETPELLRWYARDAVLQSPAADDPDLVWLGMDADVAPSDSPSLQPSPVGSGGAVSGQSFRVAQSWSPAGLRGRPLWRWLLFGQFDTLQGEQRAVLWVQAEQ